VTTLAAEPSSPPSTAAEWPGAYEAERELEWDSLVKSERFSKLSDISHSIRTRRTVEEAEFALTLEADFRSDPTILRDIDFGAILARLRSGLADDGARLRSAGVLSEEELAALRARQTDAEARLSAVAPRYARDGAQGGAVAQSVTKLRRVISKARELPLAVEMVRKDSGGGGGAHGGGAADVEGGGGLDLSAVLRESANLASATKEVWQRLNGGNSSKEEELLALQRESKALLSLRGEATKLRAGIRLVQRQKELKRKSLIRYEALQLA